MRGLWMTHQLVRSALILVALAAFVPCPLAGQSLLRISPPDHSTEGAGATDGVRRRISRQEIWEVIHAAMREQSIREADGLRPEALHVQASIWVTEDDPGLQVKKVDFDPVRQRTVFQLWASKEPRLLPFEVTTDWAPKADVVVARHDLARGAILAAGDVEVTHRLVAARLREAVRCPDDAIGQRVRRSLPAGRVLTHHNLRPPFLVTAGKPATLVAASPHLRITATVVPLQPGIKGQLIRIRNTMTQRIMKAEVVGAGLLRADF
jgi:flagella basal body P-ring formation protein FlgA